MKNKSLAALLYTFLVVSLLFLTTQNLLQAQGKAGEFPDPKIPGFSFPEPELNLDNWVFGSVSAEIYRHGWGIWTGITQQVSSNERVFETWQSPKEILAQTGMLKAQLKGVKHFLLLEKPRQFANLPKLMRTTKSTAVTPDTRIVVTVGYSPSAAQHTLTNKLLWASTIKKFLKDGYTDMPNFPIQSVTVKPVYKVITKDKLVKGVYPFTAWPGPPSTPQAFGEPDWNACVYVSLTNQGKGNGKIDYGCTGPTPETTYNLSDFINHKLTKEEADALKTNPNYPDVQAGDYIILVAMHVGTREMKRWAWQTFWWEANPDKPYEPSLQAIANVRPAQLKGAPRHYAMSVSYQMLQPAQPLTGGVNKGTPLFAYNPYLEAGFDPTVFQVFHPIDTPTGILKTEYGIQTNCTTCHMLAQFNPSSDYTQPGIRETPYAADFYLDLDDPLFKGMIKLDFAWSIIGSLDLTK